MWTAAGSHPRSNRSSPVHCTLGAGSQDRHGACDDTEPSAAHPRTGNRSTEPTRPGLHPSGEEARKNSHRAATPGTNLLSPLVFTTKEDNALQETSSLLEGNLSTRRALRARMITIPEGVTLGNRAIREQNLKESPQISWRFSGASQILSLIARKQGQVSGRLEVC